MKILRKKRQKELNILLEQHELWVKNEKRAGKQLKLDYYDFTKLDLSNRNLKDAYFNNCNLNKANFSNSNLRCAILGDCTFNQTNFSGSNLTDAHINNCILDTIITDENTLPKIRCPEQGEFIGWKKCEVYDENNEYIDDCIVKLLIPEDAKRSSSIDNKCRCSKAKVLGFYNKDGNEYELPEGWSVRSWWAMENGFIFEYKLGVVVISDKFDENRWNECTNGIHFYMSFDDACFYW